MFSAFASDTWSSVNPADTDVIFTSGKQPWHNTIIRYAHEHIFHYTDYDIIVHGRGRKCSYFLITRVFQISCETPVQIISSDRCLFHTAPSSLWGYSPLPHRWSCPQSLASFYTAGEAIPVQATATKHAGQVWLCTLSEINITARSISNQALQKGERSVSPVKGYRQPRPASPSTKVELLF